VLLLLYSVAVSAHAQSSTLRVEVQIDEKPAAAVTVVVNGTSHTTDAQGLLVIAVPAGTVEITAVKEGFNPATTSLRLAAGQEQRVLIELEPQPTLKEEVLVVATTRTGRRVEDEPIRVEVVPQEEIDEKVFMTPGDVSMMLTETNGLRVQVTSPSLGAANVRVQGLRGRYTQILADGLPLYGSAGSIGILQIPPMDLGQVEVIKGVASALYGGSALGGVINLISRRPQRDRPERELLVNRTTRGGTDGVLWLSKRGSGNWGYTLLGGGHFQERNDIDRDGWTDLPSYQRATARPRFTWDNGAGRSVFFTVGGMAEDRKGGTMPGRVAPDGSPFPENLMTRRFDAGIVARFLAGAGRVITFRSSGLGQWHRHQFGDITEHDLHHTWFAETAMTASSGKHTWVLGAALQRELYRADELPRFDYTHVVPGVFAQDDYSPVTWLTMSASGRIDHHNEFGTFFSPRVSGLLRSGTGWTLRLSTGTGFFAPTPFTEETEAVGLTRLAPLGALEAERGRSLSLDLGWKRGPMEVNATLFRSMIDHPIFLDFFQPLLLPGPVMRIVNADEPTRTMGSELIARFHIEDMDLIATHMFVWGTEIDPDTGLRREVPLNPRHTAGVDWLWEIKERVRLGVEFFYTGRQQLDDSPYRRVSEPYLLWGAVAEWRVGGARIFANVENLSDVRQTDYDRLVRSFRGPEGLWTVDAWGPLEGRILNGGVRLGF
jgi:outer membrane receptor for ferrienterochelin and colicins